MTWSSEWIHHTPQSTTLTAPEEAPPSTASLAGRPCRHAVSPDIANKTHLIYTAYRHQPADKSIRSGYAHVSSTDPSYPSVNYVDSSRGSATLHRLPRREALSTHCVSGHCRQNQSDIYSVQTSAGGQIHLIQQWTRQRTKQSGQTL